MFPANMTALCLAIVLALAPQPAAAGLFGDSELDKALEGADKDVRSLMEINERAELPFHNTRARKLLTFVAMEKEAPQKLAPADLDGAEGAYWEFSIPRSLNSMAAYLFNPEVPAHAVYPGAVRLGGWMEPEVAATALKPLQSALPDMDNPVVFRGTEYEATTPDPSSGTYFLYDLRRLVAGYVAGEAPVIISVSQMLGKSDIGKKGVAFGPPGSWYYFYSGIKGNLMTGVGWAESRMYNSASVYVLRQTAPDTTQVSLFKWVRAGWKGMNMVKRSHILAGMQAFEGNLREVLGNASLPSPQDIAAQAGAIADYSDETMREKLAPLQGLLEKSAKDNDDLQRKEFSSLVQGGYLQSLTRQDLAAELIKDYMRHVLGHKALTSWSQ